MRTFFTVELVRDIKKATHAAIRKPVAIIVSGRYGHFARFALYSG
jgi:hypothetical protein